MSVIEEDRKKSVINWYPGHMTKARRMMQEDMKLIDLLIELVDARVPLSSRNPDIDELGKNKARILLLNKADLADQTANRIWKAYFQERGLFVLEINAKTGAGIREIQPLVQQACREKLERDRKRGIVNRPVRAMWASLLLSSPLPENPVPKPATGRVSPRESNGYA